MKYPNTLNVETVSSLPEYQVCSELEDFLGDSLQEKGTFSFYEIVQQDEKDEYPATAFQKLNSWGLQDYYIPAVQGGKLKTLDETMLLLRLVSRRDLTLAISHGKTLLGTLPFWISASSEQSEQVGQAVKLGKRFALGLTEENHGSDIISNQLIAEHLEDGNFLLNGEKWSINHAYRSELITLLSKTDTKFSPRNYSMLLIDKEKYPADAFEYRQLMTMGLKGLDLACIKVKNLKVAENCLVGKKGMGLETAIKTLHISRFALASFSLGAFDTALRTTIQFLSKRVLYGQIAINIPIVRKHLINTTADLLICESFTLIGNRLLSLYPSESSILSAISKSTIPEVTNEAMNTLSSLLGARFFMRNEFNNGIFQKMRRDHAIIPVFDGNTFVNQELLISNLKYFAKIDSNREFDTTQLFSLDHHLPTLDFKKVRITSKKLGILKCTMWDALEQLKQLSQKTTIDQLLENLVQKFITHWKELDQKILNRDDSISHPYTIPVDLFEYARQFAILQIASAYINFWLHNSDKSGSLLFKDYWIFIGLHRLGQRLGIKDLPDSDFIIAEALKDISQMIDGDKLISFISIKIN